ncbi:MAG: ABC transporter ATP-binding protein [Candidatus Izemoplasmatales bacterium]
MRKLFRFLKPYWFAILMMVVLVTAQSVGSLMLPNYTSRLIGEGVTANPDGPGVVVNYAIILEYGAWMLGITLVSAAATIGTSYFSSTVSTRFGRDIRRAIYKKVNGFSLAESDKFGTSTLITRSTNDVQQVQTHTIMSFRMILTIPVMMIGGIILTIQSSPTLSQVLIAGIPALVILVTVTFLLVFPYFKSMQKKIDKLTLVGRESMSGIRVIRAFGRGTKEVARFRDANDDLNDTSMKAGRIMSFLNPSINLLFSLVMFGVVLLAYGMVTAAGVTPTTDFTALGSLFAVINYVTMIMFSIIMLTITFINYPRAEVSGKRISEILDTVVTVVDTDSRAYDDHAFKGEIAFDHVSFKYADAEKNVLDDISFTVRPGETVAIIGSTGSGKSTVINLIPRLFDATTGKVTIDGVDVREIRFAKLRSLIGFVPQTATLFTGTIAENIAYGKPDATEEEIRRAAEIAQASEFIETYENKYEHIVDQGGVNYSGGQKQRISIARAIVRRPPVFIFDDSFSALDFKTDAKLRAELKPITRDAAVLIVAQRIGTIMDATRIIVLQDGRIVGSGSHRDLMRDCTVYREIALSQLSEEELK